MHLRSVAVIVMLYCGTLVASAQTFSVSPFAAYRFGGSIKNATTGAGESIDANPSYGFELGYDPSNSGLRLALLYSHQDTDLSAGSLSPGAKIGLDIDDIMVGAVQELYDGKFRPFVGGYLGATHFRPREYDNELRFAFGVGVGTSYYFNDNFGLRLDLRGFGTVMGGDTGFLCVNGNCLVEWSGDLMWQGEVAGSVFVSF